MALFDNINSRYTQSMAKGGTYQRDASIGGYSRKELRGLGKQAKSGTLTQRERARYEHLRGERKGRRKRGLLAGLGGAAALAGGLAAAGKLGGGSGGGGLMDSIKNRLSERRGRKLQDEFGEENLASAIEGSEDQETFSREGFDDLSDMPLEEEGDIEGDESGEELGRQAAEMRAARDARERARIDADLAKNVDFKSNLTMRDSYPPTIRENRLYNQLERDTQDRSMFNEEFGEGDLYEQTEAEELRARMARRPGQPYDRSGLPDPEYRGNMEEGKMETLPGADGEEPTRGSNRPTVSQLLNRLNSVQQTGPPIRRDGPRAKFGMKVGTPKQQKIDRLRKFMKNRYR